MTTAAGLVQAKWPLRWTAITSSHSCSLMLKIIRSRRMPALLTRMSMRPKLSRAVLMMLSPPVVVAGTVGTDTGIVDDDARALFGHLDGDGAADAAAGAGDDGCFTFEQWHVHLRCRISRHPAPSGDHRGSAPPRLLG